MAVSAVSGDEGLTLRSYLLQSLIRGQSRRWLTDVYYERPPRGLGDHVVTFVEDVPSYFDTGDGSYRAIPVYAYNPVHRYLWPITRDETVIRFKVEGPSF